MRDFEKYRNRYKYVRMSRNELGILEVTLHTDGGSLMWGVHQHRELTEAFRDIALDRANRVVLLTGAGEEFLGPRANLPHGNMTAQVAAAGVQQNAAMWERDAFSDAREMTNAILDIAVPVVCAINGPVRRHCETALMSDLIIASDTASFEDSAHFELQDLVPGDGIHVIATMLLGINRARAFMLTGEPIGAQEALRLGLVAEVLPKGDVLERARAHARRIAQKSDSTLRFTRALLVHPIKKAMLELLGPGLAYEGLAALGRRDAAH
jgi:enoyl-CoA hydratase/carnithine racemase